MIILFNGPPGCGKDTICNKLIQNYSGHWVAFARHLKVLTHTIYGFYDRAWDYYESCKDIPNADFNLLSPRQAYIFVSETIIKPNFGKEYFGKALIRGQLKGIDPRYNNVFVSDSGFLEEALTLGEQYGFDYLLQVMLTRPGFNFDNDSRTYWSSPLIKSVTITNDTDIDNYYSNTVLTLEKENALL